MISNSNSSPNNPINTLQLDQPDHRLTQRRLRIRIPKKYQQEPVLSNLVSQQGLQLNITAALLGGNALGDGWFDLRLQGTSQQIDSALIYLSDLDVEVWSESDAEQDGW